MTQQEIDTANILKFCDTAKNKYGVPVTDEDCRKAISNGATSVAGKPVAFIKRGQISELELDLGNRRNMVQMWHSPTS